MKDSGVGTELDMVLSVFCYLILNRNGLMRAATTFGFGANDLASSAKDLRSEERQET